MANTFNITISHRRTTYVLESLNSTSTLASFQEKLEDLTGVPSSLQKLLFKGKKAGKYDPEVITLGESGFKDGLKITLLGSTAQELESMEDAVKEKQKKERILKERALKPAVKLRSTASPSSSSKYVFHAIQPLPASQIPTPSASEAHAYLSRLASDPAIKHIMAQHQFSVGLLTELSPLEYAKPGLRGLNVNAGQEIKLRIRTDAMDGFRNYADTRRTLCHELTHNVHGDHDNNFKELNSRLSKEVAEFERQQVQGTHRLLDGDHYQPVDEYVSHQNVLGGIETVAQAPRTVEERRSKVLEATLRRLKIQDAEIEAGCGTTGQAQCSKDTSGSRADDPS